MDTPLEQSPILALMSEYTKVLEAIALAQQQDDLDAVARYQAEMHRLAEQIAELRELKPD
ncbi:hypothetical protein [Arenicella xantha]|uniref:Uncharacterized protein n=1 Tax=Arenicella xantha TaxID=644221 RepID=A0A395JEF1_9GAMM|nr:hypothetical protein [Arenicella xantha]RBP47057.1 hypothetical protein DFR28_11020 [Arenicella xantha]